MSAIDHLDLVVTSLERSLAFYRGLSGPEECDYSPGYDAVFFYDPDQLKLEIVHRSGEQDLVAEVRRLTARLERLERERG